MRCGARHAPKHTMPKVIYKADGTRRGFITAMLAPVNCRHEPKFGVWDALGAITLACGTLGLMRLLLAN